MVNTLREFGGDIEPLAHSSIDPLIYGTTRTLLAQWIIHSEAQILMENLEEEGKYFG